MLLELSRITATGLGRVPTRPTEQERGTQTNHAKAAMEKALSVTKKVPSFGVTPADSRR